MTRKRTESGKTGGMSPLPPPGRRIRLSAGETFIREVHGPPGAPTLLLLHGWLASAGLNWQTVFEPLSQHFNIVAPDLRGHARGLRSRKIFRLADCADDCAELLLQLDTGPVIAVGYSMGGPVSQLLWRRHRDLVSGLVECATAPQFLVGTRERVVFLSMIASIAGTTRFGELLGKWPALASYMPTPVPSGRRPGSLPAWAAQEFRRHDWRQVVEAGHSIGTYNATKWISEIDVPMSVVITQKDKAIAPKMQHRFAELIPHAVEFPADLGHAGCASDRFADFLLPACLAVSNASTAQLARA